MTGVPRALLSYTGGVAEHGAVEAIEIERKYEVSATAKIPDLTQLGAGNPGAVAHIETDCYELRATYFDTADGQLGRQRVAVRRREGGSDAGWHLKTKQDDFSRELLWPLSEAIPAGLRAAITELIGSHAVASMRPIADLQTVRRVTRWAPQGSGWVLEIADDTVRGTNELTGVTQTWREWESELAPGAQAAWLDRVEPLLIAAGAKRVRGTSKLQRVMGRPVHAAAEATPLPDEQA